MTDYSVPPGCTGLQMQDGTRYPATRTGRVVVDNANHAKHIERVSGNGGGHIHRSTGGIPVTNSKHCPTCRFVGYGWQSTCPRDGSPLVDAAADLVAAAT